MAVFEVDAKCRDCKGTGLYVGMAEKDGAAVVCHTCGGTGCNHIKLAYEPFTERHPRDDVKRVFEANPGICIGEGSTPEGQLRLEDFGGMPYDAWVKASTGKNAKGHAFPPGSENRKFTCPGWWYQSADYKKKPDWKECRWGRFSSCPCFGQREECWKRWDREFGVPQGA